MPEPIYFDATCYLGNWLRTMPGQPNTPETLLAAMDHFGIHEALVVDTMSMATNPMAGNRRILETVRDHPRLHPAWAGLPTHGRELPPPEEFVAEMRECGVGALYLFYRHFDIPLESFVVDDLCAALEVARVPLFLCPNDLMAGGIDRSDWHNVVRICQTFPDLPVILTEERLYRGQRPLAEAMAACPNLHLDISTVWLHKKIEFVCRELGAERLVWGSQMPQRTPGSPLMQLNYSDISDRELALIAGGNLRRLLSWNPNIAFVDEVRFPEPTDELHRKVRTRASLREERFHDCHGHVGWCSPYHIVHETPEGLVAEMDKFGEAVCCVFSLQVIGDPVYGNDEVKAMLDQFPGRFVGFTFVNPNAGEAAMLAELQRGLDMGFRGIKLMLDSYGSMSSHADPVEVPCRFADEHGLFILSHSWGSAERIRELCLKYPRALFIAGHSTPAYAEICREVPNLYICTCPFLAWGQTEQYVQLYGAERILFGSDLTDLPIAWGMGQIMYARISEEEKRLILGGNLRRLMDQYGIQPYTQEGP